MSPQSFQTWASFTTVMNQARAQVVGIHRATDRAAEVSRSGSRTSIFRQTSHRESSGAAARTVIEPVNDHLLHDGAVISAPRPSLSFHFYIAARAASCRPPAKLPVGTSRRTVLPLNIGCSRSRQVSIAARNRTVSEKHERACVWCVQPRIGAPAGGKSILKSNNNTIIWNTKRQKAQLNHGRRRDKVR